MFVLGAGLFFVGMVMAFMHNTSGDIGAGIALATIGGVLLLKSFVEERG